ncbi:hypothetical protein TRICI_004532 [Trichomonascus ciferrii]|uniref:Uracil permease n=1 Tax=Trichomonascus ciferrii TaxID=44093 RepID=A0A642V0T6_9ASCO|nr:hypothetical protein TRICI_004532 [Trichomonascus ciferrii]
MSLYSSEARSRSGDDDAPKPSVWARTKHTFSSFENFHRAIQIRGSTHSLQNIDLLPTRVDRRVWGVVSFFCYWFSESWAIATWSYGSTMVLAGMNIWESILVVFFSNVIIAGACVMNSRAATSYHLGYPVLARASFGIYAHYFFVVLRAILGIIWGGVQLYYEGQFISICLRCIFPGWMKIHNAIPAEQKIDVQTMLGFFFAFVITLPLLFVHTYKLRHLFTVKSVLVPLAGLGVVIWAAVENNGINSNVLVDKSVRGSTHTFAFAVLGQMNAVFGATSALVVTVPDLARYASDSKAQIWGQMLGLPIAQTICAAFGILTTAAVKEMWNEDYWNVYDLLNGILDHGYTSRARAGVFFAAFAFAFATLGTTIACNIIPFAADVTCLMPKYINVVRGQLLCLLIAFAIVPWRIMADATTFVQFLGGYSIFQGSVVGIMSVDYLLLRKGNLDLRSLYTYDKHAAYYFKWGINWRAIFAFIVGFALPFPGFVADLAGSTGVAQGAFDMYQMGWLLSITTGSLSYYIAGLIFPLPQQDDEPFETRVSELEPFIEELDYGDGAFFDEDDLVNEPKV